MPEKAISSSPFLSIADKRPETAFCAEFYQNRDRRCPAADLCHLVRYNGICAELRCLLFPPITVEQATEERNLLYFTVCILRIRQNHSTIKSGMGAVVIPIL